MPGASLTATLAPLTTVPESSTPANSPWRLITTSPLWLLIVRSEALRAAGVPTDCRQVPDKPLSTPSTVAEACSRCTPLARLRLVLIQWPLLSAATVWANTPAL